MIDEGALDVFKNATKDPGVYNHGYDTWQYISHANYNSAVDMLSRSKVVHLFGVFLPFRNRQDHQFGTRSKVI